MTEAAQEKEEPSEPEIKAEVAASQIAADDILVEPEEIADPDVMVPVPEKAKDEERLLQAHGGTWLDTLQPDR